MSAIVENVDVEIQENWYEDPKVLTVNKFITKEECEHIIDLAKPNLTDSVVSDSKGGHVSVGRTSKTAWVNHFEDDITTSVANKIAKFVDIPIENAEKFQVVYYGETNEYKPHYDSWDHNGSEKTLRCIKYGGPRMVTALLYLNDVEEGGATQFTKLNIDISPEIGKLLVFENTCKDSIDKHPLSEHAGMPVIKGEKYICNLWFRQYNKSRLYSEFNPSYYENIKSTENIMKVNDTPVKKLQQLDESKGIYKQDSFITPDECQQLLDSCKFSDSKYPNAWLKNKDFPSLTIKISSLCNTPPSYFENMNIIKYDPNQIHGPFLDAYDIETEKGIKYTQKLGQRVQTIVLCLSKSIRYEFHKINFTVICNKGTVLFYNNVVDSIQRDNNISHKITNSDEIGYLCNIYVRQKDNIGNINPLYTLKNAPVSTVNKTDTVTKQVDNTPPENYMETYKHVLSLFKDGYADRYWSGYKSFTYGFKGDFDYFKDCIIQLKQFSENDKGLNLDNVNKDYEFDEFTPVCVSNVVHSEMLELLKSYYRKTISEKVFPLGDKQSNRFKAHNEPMARFLQYEILPLIEKITLKKLRPTYTYLSSYVKDSDLPAHTDRADCEYTVSFLVNKDVDWPIYLHKVKQPVKHKGRHGFNPDKEECLELDSDIGGLIIFNGTDHLHFREKYSGEFYDILLLHYRIVE